MARRGHMRREFSEQVDKARFARGPSVMMDGRCTITMRGSPDRLIRNRSEGPHIRNCRSVQILHLQRNDGFGWKAGTPSKLAATTRFNVRRVNCRTVSFQTEDFIAAREAPVFTSRGGDVCRSLDSDDYWLAVALTSFFIARRMRPRWELE